MDFFINLGILGISLILSAKLGHKLNEDSKEISGFKILDNFFDYISSDILAKINLKYGKKLFITSIICVLFYNTLGLFMVLVTVLVLSFYLVNVFINGYKFYINIR